MAKIIIIDDNKYDYDTLVNKYNTESLRKLIQHVRDYNTNELAQIEARHNRFNDEVQKQYELARACNFNIDSTNLMKGQ
jgi:hypothetical protein